MLQGVRTLAVQAANGTNTDDDRKSLTQQANAFAGEINRIAKQTKFGGKTVLNGYDGPTAEKSGKADPTPAAPAVNKGIYDQVTGDKSKYKLGSIKFQVGANSGDSISLTMNAFYLCAVLDKVGITDAGTAGQENGIIKITDKDEFRTSNLSSTNSLRFSLTSAVQASALIKTIDSMLNVVDTQRGTLGAIQNRLESTIRNQSNVAANQTDARSRIRDADFAQESANLSQQSIIQQAASSMLTQANARPQLALSLLG